MATQIPTISVLATEEQISSYQIEHLGDSYPNWSSDKIVMIKNIFIKAVCKFLVLELHVQSFYLIYFKDDELKEIISPKFGTVCDGTNKSFCLTLQSKGKYSKQWCSWWLDFSRMKGTKWHGRGFGSITFEDYNYSKLGIKSGWFQVKPLHREGIKVCFS